MLNVHFSPSHMLYIMYSRARPPPIKRDKNERLDNCMVNVLTTKSPYYKETMTLVFRNHNSLLQQQRVMNDSRHPCTDCAHDMCYLLARFYEQQEAYIICTYITQKIEKIKRKITQPFPDIIFRIVLVLID